MINSTSKKPTYILVTGAAGFIGQHVVVALLNHGHKVVALQHRKELPSAIQGRCEQVLSGDICNPHIQQEALQNVDTICHLSAHIPEQLNDFQDAILSYRVNAQATLELATLASKQGIRRFIHLSTGNMYSPSDRPCIETDSLFPPKYATNYFMSKLASEIYLEQACHNTTMDAVIFRISTPYGPGEPNRKVIPTFMKQAAQGQTLRLLNGGASKFDFVYVADVADCVVRAVESGPPGIYNVASGEHTSLRLLADTIIKVYREHEVSSLIESTSQGDFPGFPAISVDKARQTWRIAPLHLVIGLSRYRVSLENEKSVQ